MRTIFYVGACSTELLGVAEFSPREESGHVAFVCTGSVTVRISILCEYGEFFEGVERIRRTKDTSHLSVAESNQRFNKSANISVRNLLPENGIDPHTFGDLKMIHAAIHSKCSRTWARF